MPEITTYTMGPIQGGSHHGSHTQQWFLDDGAAANALYDRIMNEFPRRFFEVWKMEPEPACLEYYESLDGLRTDSDPLFLLFRSDMDKVIELVRETMTELIRNAIDHENVKHFRHTAKLVARVFMPRELKRAQERGDAQSQTKIEQCRKETQVRVDNDFAAYLAPMGETDRIALTESLVSMETAIRLYMTDEYERMRVVEGPDAEENPEIMNFLRRRFLHVKWLKRQIMKYLGVECRGDDDIEEEELEELMELMESLADELQQACDEEFIRLLKDNIGQDFVPEDAVTAL